MRGQALCTHKIAVFFFIIVLLFRWGRSAAPFKLHEISTLGSFRWCFLFHKIYTKGADMHVYYQPNPQGKITDDCVIRAVTKALDIDWETATVYLAVQQNRDADIFTRNYVWGNLLTRNGFSKHHLPDTCPDCYTVKDFCNDHRVGVFVLGTGDHALTVVDGDYYDTFDSGELIPVVYYRKER